MTRRRSFKGKERGDFFYHKKKSEFTYRGKSVNDLRGMSIEQLMAIVPARIRRSLKRGFTPEQQSFLKLLQNTPLPEEGKKPKVIRTHCRDLVVLPAMFDYVIGVHNGKSFVEVRIRPQMIGHYLGEFAMTRGHVSHGTPGIGASKSSMAIKAKK